MKVNYILLISLLIVGLLIPSVSADIIIAEDLNEWLDTSGRSEIRGSGLQNALIEFQSLHFTDITKASTLNYIVFEGDGNKAVQPEGVTDITWTATGLPGGTGYLHTDLSRDAFGVVTKTRITIFLNNWDIGSKTGTCDIFIDKGFYKDTHASSIINNGTSYVYIGWDVIATANPHTSIVSSGILWQNALTVNEINTDYQIDLTRNIGGNYYLSTLEIYDNEAVIFSDTHSEDIGLYYPKSMVDGITVYSPSGQTYQYPLSSLDTSSSIVTVYVQNSQTGALIADTNLNVNLYETETWYNSTLEWGWDTIQLPAGNYEFYAEKSGFTQYAPGRLIVDGVDDNINLLLYPDVVAPPVGNLTLQFWVCDSNSNGIPYAELSVIGLAGEGAYYDSGIIQTNNLGYATLTAPGNSTYTAYASKPGYTAGENEFGVTTVSPVHIAVMLMAGEIPTNPTPTQPGVTPTVTPTVRPTDVAPGNNPIDNFRIMFLNMGFDDAYSDWLTGLFIICIGAALGYCLVRKVGAMCGAPIGLLTAVGLGLIPIWALVLIIVIVALAYAKFFMGR